MVPNVSKFPEGLSPLSRFLAEAISPLPPTTPTRPRAMLPNKPRPTTTSNTPSSFSLPSQKRDIEPSQPSASPGPKRHTSHTRQPSPSPVPQRFRSDHRSRKITPRPVSRTLKASERHKQGDNFRSSSLEEGEVREDLEENEKEAMPLLPPRLVASPSKKYPSLLAVGIVGKGMNKEEEKLCYNCGKKGHWFLDCVVGCGRCGGDGHRTMDCSIMSSRGGTKRLRETKWI